MYKLDSTNQFKRDVKLSVKRGLNQKLLQGIINSLVEKGNVDKKYKPHLLKGRYKDLMECHIQPDWLLIWEQNERIKLITLYRTGTHSDLFNK
jgi:mRNA interferase YafQ